MHNRPSNDDKAGREYWDKSERNQSVEFEAFGPLPGVRGYGRRMWHSVSAHLRGFGRWGRRLLNWAGVGIPCLF
jgi:hypothetical protein